MTYDDAVEYIEEEIYDWLRWEVDAKAPNHEWIERIQGICTTAIVGIGNPVEIYDELGRRMSSRYGQIPPLIRMHHRVIQLETIIGSRLTKKIRKNVIKVLLRHNPDTSRKELREVFNNYPVLMILPFIQKVWLETRPGFPDKS